MSFIERLFKDILKSWVGFEEFLKMDKRKDIPRTKERIRGSGKSEVLRSKEGKSELDEYTPDGVAKLKSFVWEDFGRNETNLIKIL